MHKYLPGATSKCSWSYTAQSSLSCRQGAGSASSGQGRGLTIPHCPEASRWAGAGTWLARAVRVQLTGSDQGTKTWGEGGSSHHVALRLPLPTRLLGR